MTVVTLGQILMAGFTRERLAEIFMEHACAVNRKGAAAFLDNSDIPAGESLVRYFKEICSRAERNPALREGGVLKPILDVTSAGMTQAEEIALAVKDLTLP